MKLIFALLSMMLASGVLLAQQEELPVAMRDLFNGKNLEGWVKRGGDAMYRVEDGVIVGSTVPKTPNTFLCTEEEYGDFVLELEFRVDPRLNSGVQIRSLSDPDYKEGRVYGYQVEIDPSDRAWTGGIYDEARRGWLSPLSANPKARLAFRQGEWNRFRVVALGPRIRTYINGVPAAELEDSETDRGFIALQVHGVGNLEEPLEVRFRGVRLADLTDTDLSLEELTPGWSGVVWRPVEATGPLVVDDAAWKTLGEGFQFTEGPAVSPEGRIFFNDIPNERTHIFDPGSGEISVFREETGRANGLFFAPTGALLACEGGNRRVTRTVGDEVKVVARESEGKKLNSPNDLVLDGFGGFYFTDPRYGQRDDMEMEVEGVYYVDRRGKLTRVADDLTKPNGIIMRPDGSVLYVADPGAETIWVYDVAGPGEIANRRRFAPVGSDGMTIDERGNVYCTWKGEVIVFSPEGQELLRMAPPEAPANCLLVGNILYVTARKGFYSTEMLVSAPY